LSHIGYVRTPRLLRVITFSFLTTLEYTSACLSSFIPRFVRQAWHEPVGLSVPFLRHIEWNVLYFPFSLFSQLLLTFPVFELAPPKLFLPSFYASPRAIPFPSPSLFFEGAHFALSSSLNPKFLSFESPLGLFSF